MPDAPRCRPSAPSVAKRVTKSQVAEFAEIPMYVLFAGDRHLVYAEAAVRPVEVEVLPERRRAHVQHPAPEIAHRVERALVFACRAHRLQHVVAVECRHATMPFASEAVVEHLLRISKPRKRKHGGGRLRAMSLERWLAAETLPRIPADLSKFRVSESIGHECAVVERQCRQSLHAGEYRRAVAFGRPVKERTSHALEGVGWRHERGQAVECIGEIAVMPFEIRPVACKAVPLCNVPHPPERIWPHAVHPLRIRIRCCRHVVKRLRQNVRRAEHIQHHHRLRVHVAHPHKPVALDAVPDIVLAA